MHYCALGEIFTHGTISKRIEHVHLLVNGGREKGLCAVPKCDHPEMELLHK
jgi:hypothetical protein